MCFPSLQLYESHALMRTHSLNTVTLGAQGGTAVATITFYDDSAALAALEKSRKLIGTDVVLIQRAPTPTLTTAPLSAPLSVVRNNCLIECLVFCCCLTTHA